MQAFGRELFDALFIDDVRSLFDSSRHRAAQDDEQLRLVLRIRAPELARLPWEFLYDPRRDDYLGLSVSLVRFGALRRGHGAGQTAHGGAAAADPRDGGKPCRPGAARCRAGAGASGKGVGAAGGSRPATGELGAGWPPGAGTARPESWTP
ncbi:MAG: hypothetical protein ACRDYX_21960 [Egibacteraceae bacterium]